MTVTVPPPVPAPYLADVPPLSDDVIRLMDRKRLPASDRARVKQELQDRMRRIMEARQRYQAEHGVKIAVEPGWSE